MFCPFSLMPIMYGFSKWPDCRELKKTQRHALKRALNKKTFSDDQYEESLIQHNSLPISIHVRNDLIMSIEVSTLSVR